MSTVSFSFRTSLGSRLFLLPESRALQNVLHGVIAFMAGVLVNVPARRRPRHLTRPRPFPRRRVLYRETIQQRLVIHTSEPLHHVQVLRRSAEPRLVGEIRGVDNERVAFPMSHRIAHPLPDV